MACTGEFSFQGIERLSALPKSMLFRFRPFWRALSLAGLLIATLGGGSAMTWANPDDAITASWEITTSEDAAEVKLQLSIAEGWAVFTQRARFGGIPTTLEWAVPEAWTDQEIDFPSGQWAEKGGLEEFFWQDEVTFLVRWQVAEGAGEDPRVELLLRLQAVDPEGSFYPVELVLTSGEPEAPGTEGEASPATGFWETLSDRSPVVLLLINLAGGFIGGLILNIMPCILPVIGIKVMSLVKHAGDDPQKAKRHGWTFTAGVVVSFWILALVVTVLQGLGTSVGQGFHLQNFIFVIFITSLIFLLALSMMGVFMIDLGSGGYQKANQLAGKQGYAGSFFNGFLVTLLSTPCSAPILAGAMTFAFTQPPLLSFIMFTSIALGLAFPYTLLGHKPHWVKFLPKPGMWMEYFKQIMGFLMMSMVIFLLTVIEAVRGGTGVIWTIAWLLILGMVAWLYGTFVTGKGKKTRRRAYAFMVALLMVGVFSILEGPLQWRMSAVAWAQNNAPAQTDRADDDGLTPRRNTGGVIEWVPYRAETFPVLMERDQPVFVNFTAAWCITCKVNEQRAMERDDTWEIMQNHNFVAVYGDWTDQNEEIRQKLAEYERVGVPLNLVFGKDRDNPIILPELYSAGRLHRALEEAAATFR